MSNGTFSELPEHPAMYWIPVLVVLVVAAVAGTFGNITILFLIFTRKKLRNVETIFIVNLAISDLYVTLVGDPMSLIAKVEGEAFFDRFPGLCRVIASLCTISCVTSLLTISMMSMNRYFYICYQSLYKKIFTKWNCVCICISLYSVGGLLVALNALGIGDHTFDRRSLECIWDRMATYYYTVAFSITLVWIPSIVIAASYLRMFLFVRQHTKRLQSQTQSKTNAEAKTLHLAKTLFVIYAVFVICWAPYALLIVIDADDTYSHEVHVYITAFAHLHPSINWLIYYGTNKNFTEAYRDMFASCLPCLKIATSADRRASQLDVSINRSSQNTDTIYMTETAGVSVADVHIHDGTHVPGDVHERQTK